MNRDRGIFKQVLAMQVLAVFALSIAPGHALAQHSHSHGVGKLNIAIDGANLTLRLELPLEDLVGFERAPRDDKERETIRRAADSLRRADALFVPTAAAGCTLAAVQLASPILAPELLGDAAAPKPPANAKTGGHAELTADVAFRCSAPAALKGIEVKLFDAFKRVKRLNVQRVGPTSQKSGRLTPSTRRLEW